MSLFKIKKKVKKRKTYRKLATSSFQNVKSKQANTACILHPDVDVVRSSLRFLS